MPFAIIIRDRPGMLDKRNEVRPAHIDYLTANQDKLLAAGALLEDDGSGGHGGILLVDVDTREQAQAFIDADPFTQAGLFESITISRWRKAYLDRVKYV